MAMAMRLEICIVGPQAGEVGFLWVGTDQGLESRREWFDSFNVTYSNVSGKEMRNGIQLQTRIGLAGSIPITQNLANGLANDSADGMTEEAGNADDAE
jgi:hypothetical protein